jgi:hypothetical protein
LWSNEWDLCDYFDKSDDDNDDGQGGRGNLGFNDPGDNKMAHAAYIADCIQGLLSFDDPLVDNTNESDINDPNASEVTNIATTFDILGYLSTYYGFVCPLSKQNPQLVNGKAWDNCMRALNYVAGTTNPPLPDFHKSIICFVHALQTSDGPNSNNFDAFPNNCITVNCWQFSDAIAQVDSFFLVQPHAFQVSLPWSIAVYNLSWALAVFQLLLQVNHSSASLAHILLKEEVAFHTLLLLANVHLKISSSDIVTQMPVHLSNYVLKPSSYKVYIHQCSLILSSPRGCAALLQGRIVGHLAKEHLGIESACLGPSSSVTIYCIGFTVTDK